MRGRGIISENWRLSVGVAEVVAEDRVRTRLGFG